MKKKTKTVTVYRTDAPAGILPQPETGKKGYKLTHSVYRDDGQLLTETRYGEDGETEEKIVNTYDSDGRLTEEITYLGQDEIAEHMTYERDPSGQVMTAYKHYQDGEKDTIKFKRDDSGRLLEKTTIDSYDEEESKEIIDYDDDRVVMHRVYEYDELMLEESYTYDEDGNMTEHTKWTIDEEDARYVNTFDKAGNITKVRKYNMKGKLLSKMDYHYEAGRLAGITEENPYGTNTTTLLYDEKGNPVEQAEVDQNGEINSKADRTFNENGDVITSEVFINMHGRGINQHYLLTYEYAYFD